MYLQGFGIDPSQMGKGLHGFATGRILQMQRHVGTKFAQQSLINKVNVLLHMKISQLFVLSSRRTLLLIIMVLLVISSFVSNNLFGAEGPQALQR
jgi:hypothetical protein